MTNKVMVEVGDLEKLRLKSWIVFLELNTQRGCENRQVVAAAINNITV